MADPRLLIEAADGYKVLFALAELDPDFAPREIILADTRDGKPLDAKEGPFRVVVPGDKKACPLDSPGEQHAACYRQITATASQQH